MAEPLPASFAKSGFAGFAKTFVSGIQTRLNATWYEENLRAEKERPAAVKTAHAGPARACRYILSGEGLR